MFSFVLVLSVAVISASANPSPQTIARPLAAVSPAVVPAVVTAHSYQVISRNYNALASPIRAAALLKNAPSLLSRPPIVAAESSPLLEARITSGASNRSSEDSSSDLSRANSLVDSRTSQVETTRTASPTTAAAASMTNAPQTSSARSSLVNPSGTPAVPVGSFSGPSAVFNAYSAAYSAFPAGARAVSVGSIPASRAAYSTLSAASPYVISSAYFPSAYTTSNYLTYPRLF